MKTVGVLLDRNARYCGPVEDPSRHSIVPRLPALVLTCADHRVDPAHVLGIDLGDAVVLRNVGGRVTPDILTNLALLATIKAVEAIDVDFELIVMHHTDCGLSRLAGEGYVGLLAGYLGLAAPDVPKAQDPQVTVRFDVDRLRSSLPPAVNVWGVVYDIATGRVRVVCPAANDGVELSTQEP
jgi:carbonic anhydrase